MAVLDTNPHDLNFLSPLGYKFLLRRAPSLSYFVQRVNIPGLSLQDIGTNNPNVRIPYPGEHLMFEELRVTFKVDENLQNYLEIHNWLRGAGKQTFATYGALDNRPSATDNTIKSDIVVTILTSDRTPNFEVTYTDAFPISVSSLNFASTDSDVVHIEADAAFRYTTYEIKAVS